MDLKQLKTFIRVAEAGSLSKASDRLRLAQPALSRQIKLLEASVGAELFSRHGRGMELTEAGRELLARVSGIVHQLETSIDEVRTLKSIPTGSVALGLMPSVSDILAARIAIRVAAELPSVSLRIVEGYAGNLVDWLHRGELDVTLLYGPSSDLHLRVTSLLFEELHLVGPASSSLDAQTSCNIRSLDKFELVLPSRTHGLRAVVEAAARKARIDLKLKFEADSYRVLKELVEAGLGYTVLPPSAIRRELSAGTLRSTPFKSPKIQREIILALPSSRTDTRATKAVTEIMLDEIGRMIADGTWHASPVQVRPDFPKRPTVRQSSPTR